MAARLREKHLTVIVKTTRAKAFQRIAAKNNALEARANTFYAQNGKFAKAQFIAYALRVT